MLRAFFYESRRVAVIVRVMRTLTAVLALLLFSNCLAVAQDWGTPVWQDEFNQAAGSQLDPAKWTFDIGDPKVNHEVEIYCPGYPASHDQLLPRSEGAWKEISVCDGHDGNVSFDGEHLVLRAVRHGEFWTSGRIKTQGRRTFEYGRIEARMKLPFGAGIWPAFWALGDDIPSVSWPGSGEMDIMENVPEHGGLGPSRIRSTVHGPGYSGDYGPHNDVEFPSGQRVDNGYHTYGAIWSPFLIQFYLDDPNNVFFVMTPRQLPAGKAWVYNHPFFLILNLAIGSSKSWSGAFDSTTPNPAEVRVDYVRVYEAVPVEAPKFELPAAVSVKSGGSTDAAVRVTAKPGSGRMYVECLSISSGVHCEANPYVLDFTNSGEKTVVAHITTEATPIEKGSVKLTVFPVSEEHASVDLPLTISR